MFLGALGLQATHREFFARLVPSYLARYQHEAVLGTQALLGVAGVSMLIPPLRPVARWAALGVLVPSLPEAFNQVRQPDRMEESGVPPQAALARIPVQALVIAWTWRATRRR
jgi:uncharacterized membrane protein